MNTENDHIIIIGGYLKKIEREKQLNGGCFKENYSCLQESACPGYPDLRARDDDQEHCHSRDQVIMTIMTAMTNIILDKIDDDDHFLLFHS